MSATHKIELTEEELAAINAALQHSTTPLKDQIMGKTLAYKTKIYVTPEEATQIRVGLFLLSKDKDTTQYQTHQATTTRERIIEKIEEYWT